MALDDKYFIKSSLLVIAKIVACSVISFPEIETNSVEHTLLYLLKESVLGAHILLVVGFNLETSTEKGLTIILLLLISLTESIVGYLCWSKLGILKCQTNSFECSLILYVVELVSKRSLM